MARSMGGGRSGGRSGGSRSGGSRSSSSRSMGSRRSGSSRSFGSGRSGGSSVRGTGRSYSGSRSSGNPLMGGGYNSGHHHHHYHRPTRHHYHSPYRRRTYYRGGTTVVHNNGCGCGCSSFFGVIIMMIVILALFSSFSGTRRSNSKYYNYKAPSYNDSYSNVERDKFDGLVQLNGYYSDPDGILYDDEIKPLEKGLKHFYETTGVCAFVYFVEELEPGVDGIEEAAAIYDELFNDEGHILLLYDYTNAYMYDACGYEIATTLDSEAIDILYDYVEAKWSQDSENLGEIFGGGLAEAADRIMYKERSFGEKYKSIIITVIVSIVVIIIVSLLYKWWKAKKAQENKEQEDLEKVLSTPLETFGTTVDDLAAKYDDPNNNVPPATPTAPVAPTTPVAPTDNTNINNPV
ncbi:MAG: TPM domain-containing protein [Lachnospiraceae bacterium]|nr:TPM domain-containing protein [Lachnospiraceae bacterium]